MYDYIIVGAGSAGCVLANRLSEDPAVSVLLLEAGGPDTPPEVSIPVASGQLLKSASDWIYETEPQEFLNQRNMYWPRGKVLGGTGSINSMMYLRGHQLDFDGWQQQGNRGWSYDEVLPYFKKSEHQERGASPYHGTDGPLSVTDLRSPNALSHAFLKAAEEQGYPANTDFNAAQQDGAGLIQVNQKDGERASTATAFLRPALERPNLTLQTGALTTRVLLQGTRATGVEYHHNGQRIQASASQEVLLCGGTVNSPQLLLLSGIGSAEQLQSLGIPVTINLPGVGENLQDHIGIAVNNACTQPVSLAIAETQESQELYFRAKKGPLSSPGAEAAIFLKTRANLPAPDLELLFVPSYYVNRQFDNPPGHGFTIGAIILVPQNRGRISLRSANPEVYPQIQPNYLNNEADIALLIEGIRRCRQLAASPAFDAYRGAEYTPGAQAQSDAEIVDFLRVHAHTIHHPVGTCKMGHDPMAVIDDRLRVHGIERLRVCDASIMPSMIRGHTNAATVMIAEKCADMIKQSPQTSA